MGKKKKPFFTYPRLICDDFEIDKSLSVPLPAHGFKSTCTVRTPPPHKSVNQIAANQLFPACF
jgi:hypothetical protein